jgi:hypothetical protein
MQGHARRNRSRGNHEGVVCLEWAASGFAQDAVQIEASPRAARVLVDGSQQAMALCPDITELGEPAVAELSLHGQVVLDAVPGWHLLRDLPVEQHRTEFREVNAGAPRRIQNSAAGIRDNATPPASRTIACLFRCDLKSRVR